MWTRRRFLVAAAAGVALPAAARHPKRTSCDVLAMPVNVTSSVHFRPGGPGATATPAALAVAAGFPAAAVPSGPAFELAVSISGPEPSPADSMAASVAFSNANAGTQTTNYRYEGVTSTSTHNHLTFGFLAGRGWQTVKIPTRWERLTRNSSSLTPATLNSAEMALLDTEITEAGSQGFHVIIDLHNYGQYYADGAQTGQGASGTGFAQALGTVNAGITWTNAFSGFWSAMATRYLSNPTVTGFHLMNEPNATSGAGALTRANWYAAAQAAVTAIRAVDTGGRFILRVGGWEWSSCANWTAINTSAWITDPVAPQNLWYEAHHYWDQNGSGVFTTYAAAVTHATGRGFTSTFRGTTYPDALYSMVLSDLYDFKQWLITAGTSGVIGETGVPNQTTVSAGDETAWCALVNTYLPYVAQLGGIGVDVWNCGEWQGGWSNQLSCYADSNRFVSGVDTAGTVSAPWEAELAALSGGGGTAISFGAAGTPATGTTTISPVVPAGAVAGQVAIMSVVAATSADVLASVTSSGWAQLTPAKDNGSTTPYPTITVLWKAVAPGDIGATQTLTFANTPDTCTGVISTYGGVNTTTPFEAQLSGIETGSGVTAHAAGPITTTLDTDWVVTAFGDRTASAWTPPGGFTERTDTATAQASLETADSNGPITHGSLSATATGTVATSQCVWWIGALKGA